ncbi:hypothetical protein BJX64DRAFT_295588 [Aspergillus heterothallicus]
MWLVEMFLDALGVPFTMIKSSMNMEQRTAACDYFNDPNSDCAMLLTTYICGAYGLNLQAACCRVVMLESAPNVSTVKQVAGRVHRPGQTEAQKVLFLFQDHIIQRWMEWNNVVKFIPEVAACLPVKVAHDIRTKARLRVAVGEGGGQDKGEVLAAENDALAAEADREIQKLFGQRTS